MLKHSVFRLQILINTKPNNKWIVITWAQKFFSPKLGWRVIFTWRKFAAAPPLVDRTASRRNLWYHNIYKMVIKELRIFLRECQSCTTAKLMWCRNYRDTLWHLIQRTIDFKYIRKLPTKLEIGWDIDKRRTVIRARIASRLSMQKIAFTLEKG